MPITGPIIVATDFSTRSDRALRRATIIARQSGAALVLAHVVDDDQPRHLVDHQLGASRAILDETVATIERMDGIAAGAELLAGDVFSGILQIAEQAAADLIVVGPHRRKLRDVFMGTTAERTIAHSRRPVLMAAGVPSAPYDRALLALDLDEASQAPARIMQELGLVDSADIIAMHAFDVPGQGMMRRALIEQDMILESVADAQAEARADFVALLADIGLKGARTVTMPANGSPARRILESARDEGASLIIVGTSQRAGIERFMLGSIAETVLGDADRDVLVVPAP